MMAEDEKEPDHGGDFVVLGPQNEDGSVSCVRHWPDHSVSVGSLHPVEDGRPFDGELIRLDGDGPVHKVETIWGGAEAPSRSGPVMVNSRAFGDGWDRIFGKPAPVGEA